MRRCEPGPVAVGLDLGSTVLKAALLDGEGNLGPPESVPAPPLQGEDGIRQGDATAYIEAARGLLTRVAGRVAAGTPLGVASQRSSFVIWGRDDGRPRTPLISWQDRRAAGWCDTHRDLEPEIVRRTGLPLSAHYAGPKLAALRGDPDLAPALEARDSLFGTLDCFLTWTLGGRTLHETDLTVAARTLMVDLEREDWHPALVEGFGVDRRMLPRVTSSVDRSLAVEGGFRLTATLSDQAAAALPVFDAEGATALINLGTGAFVLLPEASASTRKTGYLTAPILGRPSRPTLYALEGTVNGAGPAVDRFDPGPTTLTGEDIAPDAFALPDLSGLGSPHWIPGLGLALSSAAERLGPPERRRVVLEGLLFRLREILEDLCETGLPDRIVLSGGLTRDPAVGPGMAALLARPVEILQDRESGLLGAARLAAGLEPWASPATERIEPTERGAYLRDKFRRWKPWFESLREGARG